MGNDCIRSVLGFGRQKAFDYIFYRIESNLARYFKENTYYSDVYERIMNGGGIQAEELFGLGKAIGMARVRFQGKTVLADGERFCLVDDYTVMINIGKLIKAVSDNELNNKIEILNEVIDHEVSHIIQYIEKSIIYDRNIYYPLVSKTGHNVGFRNIMRFFGYRSAKSTIQLIPQKIKDMTKEDLEDRISNHRYRGAKNSYNFYNCACKGKVVLLDKKENGFSFTCNNCGNRLRRINLRVKANKNVVINEINRLYSEFEKKDNK